MFAWDTEARAGKPEGMSWDEYKMVCGVSVGATVPLFGEGLQLYTDQDEPPNDLETLRKRLMDAPFTVSYNGKGWDRVVLANTLGRPIPIGNEVDLWYVVKQALGNTRWEKGTWKLGEVCKRTLREGKTLEGAGAPALVSQGRWGALIEYCTKDVLLTKQLFWHMVRYGYVIAPFSRVIQVREVIWSELDRVGATKIISGRAQGEVPELCPSDH